jgi:hypothetical protein
MRRQRRAEFSFNQVLGQPWGGPGWHARRYSDGREVPACVATPFAIAQSVHALRYRSERAPRNLRRDMPLAG